jgi:hypothetical protein
MMLDRYRARRFRRAVVLTQWLALPSLSLLAIAACAASEDRDEPEADTRVVVPASDAGGDTSQDEAEADAPFVPCVEDGLCPVPTPLTIGSVVAIRGRSNSDVWASGSGGVFMRWDGQQWTNIDSPLAHTASSLFLTSDELWGASGTVVLRRGIDPNSVRMVDTTPSAYLESRPFTGIVILANRDVYLSVATSSFDDWFHAPETPPTSPLAKFDFDAKTLTYTPPPIHPSTKEPQSLGQARAAYLVPDKAIWVVGDRGAVARYPVSPSDGGSHGDAGSGGEPLVGQGVVIPLASQVDLFAAWGQGDHLWTAGASGTILHFDGSHWRTEDTGTTSTLHAIFGFGANDIWAAGDDGTLLHFDGNVWSRMDVGTYRGSMRAIWGATSNDVWIGGERIMLHWGARP